MKNYLQKLLQTKSNLSNYKDISYLDNKKLLLKEYRLYRKKIKYSFNKIQNKKDNIFNKVIRKNDYIYDKIHNIIIFYENVKYYFYFIFKYRKLILNLNKGWDYFYLLEILYFKLKEFVKFYESGYWYSLSAPKYAYVCYVTMLACERLMTDDYQNDERYKKIIINNDDYVMRESIKNILRQEDLYILTNNLYKYLFYIWD